MSGARNDTSQATKSYRGGAIGGTMPPNGNTNPSQTWEENCSTPAPDSNPQRRSDRAAFQIAALPANAGNLAYRDGISDSQPQPARRLQRGGG